VGNGIVEDLTVLNHGTEEEKVDLRLDFGADFCDLFEVKDAIKKKGKVLSGSPRWSPGLRLQA